MRRERRGRLWAWAYLALFRPDEADDAEATNDRQQDGRDEPVEAGDTDSGGQR